MSPALTAQGDSSKQTLLFTGNKMEEPTTDSEDTTAGSNSPPLFKFDIPETGTRVRRRPKAKPFVFRSVLQHKGLEKDDRRNQKLEPGSEDRTLSGSSSVSVSRSRSPSLTDSSEGPDPEEIIVDKSGRSAFGTPNPIGAMLPTSSGVCHSRDSFWR